MRADVPIGVYLSGGIDSSAVLSLMREHTQSTFDAFTLSFDREYFDEAEIAREMAAHAGVRHSVIDVDAGVLAPNFEDTVWHNECPFGNSNTIAKFVLSRHVRAAGLKVVLTGEGSDEVFGGYSHYLQDMRQHSSNALGPAMGKAVRRLKRAFATIQGRAAAPPEQVAEYAAVRAKMGFVPAQLLWTGSATAVFGGLRSQDFRGCARQEDRFSALMNSLDSAQLEGVDALNRSLYLSCKSMLPNRILTTLGDRVEMANSIEARLPFLDHRVVEFLTRLPVGLKIKVGIRGGTEKYLLKQAARGHVTDTLYRRTKHPFTAPPTSASATDAMAQFIGDTLHGRELRELQLYDQAEVLKLYQASKERHRGVFSGLFMHLAGMAIMQRRFGLSVG